MNKDLDERLVPNGEYRNALNVEVSTSEGSDVGTVQNILGNYKLAASLIPDGYACVGSISNEKTNKLYWFISSYSTDAIVEYDLENNKTNYVIVDTKAGTASAVLKFFGNVITGINIIDNLLFWTDNRGEPKKINIDICKTGTTDIETHTKIYFKNGSFNGITIALVSPWSGTDPSHAAYFNGSRPQTTGRIAWLEAKQMRALLGVDNIPAAAISDGLTYQLNHYRNGKFLGKKEATVGNDSVGLRFQFKNDPGHSNDVSSNYPDLPDSSFNTTSPPWLINNHRLLPIHVGDVVFGDNISLDIQEQHVTVIKPRPLNVLSVQANHTEQSLNTSKIPNLFETTFPRFSYRYRFVDGEYSAFAPFTQPVFNAKYPKDTSKSIDGSVSYTKDNAYDIKEPYNKAMANSIHSIDLSDFITAQTPEDVVEIEILYKKEDSSVIYSIGTINHVDSEWHDMSNHEGLGIELGALKSDSASGSYIAEGSFMKGKYTVTTENIYAALPANQLLRPWDNVPRKALAQEVSGNRIIYGNYLQNYEIPYLPTVSLNYDNRKTLNKSFETEGLKSIKSQRNYQLGVVLTDKYGRDTPVFTSNNGAVNIPWQDSIGNKNASKSNQLVASVGYEFPDWVDTLKFFVKQTSNEYYNLIMQRAWVTKSTYELDNSEGHIWISFPSSDRNKISDEDYIILKKKIEPNASQVTFENKFKVIDVKNEAPDSIKYRLVNYGTAANNGSQTGDASDLFDTASSPDFYDTITQKGTDTLRVDHSKWQDSINGVLEQQLAGQQGDDGLNTKDLYVSWSRVGGGGDNMASKKYKVVAGFMGSNNYNLKLSNHISKTDADIAHCFGDAATNTTAFNAGSSNTSGQLDPNDGLHPDLVFQIERKELIDSEDFSGSFFVKISKNQVSSIVETGNEVNELDKYKVLAKNGHWFFRDDTTSSASGYISALTADYGLTNYNGTFGTVAIDAGDDHQSSGSGHTNSTGGGAAGSMRLSDNSAVWSTILSAITTHSKYTRFFVDAVHMVAGQSDASDYAKYSCITWSGATLGDSDSKSSSSWSYPPLKKWLSDQDGLDDYDSIYYQNNLVSEFLGASINNNYSGLKVDGWVGPLQNVSRDEPKTTESLNNNHINGLEGIVTTVEDHTIGPRRWFSGMDGVDSGVGQNTKTYANGSEQGRHFMHLSFFAPGKNLHNGIFTEVGSNLRAIYGPTSFAANLQGIWGGGVFTGETPSEVFGDGSGDGFKHFPMEGNHNSSFNPFTSQTPAPGVGQGYDMNHRELHERQWDPTFLHDSNSAFIGDPQNETRDFIRNLYPGSKFRFKRPKNPKSSVDEKVFEGVYTIKKVQVKKLYNHTSWRKAYNRYVNNEGYDPTTLPHLDYRSVEEVALEYLDTLADDGSGGDATNLKSKIEDFGASHNRRLCYIIELDKNPVDIDSPLGSNFADGDINNQHFNNIEFLDPIQDLLLSDLSKFPAVWELDPKKQQTDLDIYYEASSAIPIRINNQTNELFAPVGCRVELINAPSQLLVSDVYLEYWDDDVAYFNPGFTAIDGINEIDYTNTIIKFIKQDGSYVIAEAGQQQLIGLAAATSDVYKSNFVIKRKIGSNIEVGLPWYNCFSFGNGLESNRIKDDFNEVFITNGVKASTTSQEAYKQERRKSGLIYSGIYNSNSGINNLNQFIQAEKITKDLNPTYGSIQKLFSRNSDLVAFCEDKVLKILANKDALFNADGNAQLTSNENVLGQTIPFVGEYGISKNPESFASESYRAYFTDKQRGAVLRLSKDGLTPISKAGMHDWFRDNLSQYYFLLGTYDAYKEDYNITLGQWPGDVYTENIIFNSSISLGEELGDFENQNLDLIDNGGVYGTSGTYQTSLNDGVVNFPDNPNFDWANTEERFHSDVTVTNHDEIPQGYFQEEIDDIDEVLAITTTADVTDEVDFVGANYLTFNNGLHDGGWWYDPGGNGGFMSISSDLFGSSATINADAEATSSIRRAVSGSFITENSNITYPAKTAGYTTSNPTISDYIRYYIGSNSNASTLKANTSQCVTRNNGGGSGTNKAIVFDRPEPPGAWVEFQAIGGNTDGQLDLYIADGGTDYSGGGYDAFFNGDELHIQFEIMCWPTFDGTTGSNQAKEQRYGYNHIIPKLELIDGDTGQVMDTDKFCVPSTTTGNLSGVYGFLETEQSDMGTEWENITSSNDDKYIYPVNTTSPDFVCIKGGCSPSGTVLFPDTSPTGASSNFNVPDPGTYIWQNMNPLANWNPVASNRIPLKLRLGATFKFRDPAQQILTGAANSTIDTTNAGIREANVVNNLRIRISNHKVYTGSLYNYETVSGSGNKPLRYPLWEVHKLFCKKGKGVTSTSTGFEAEIVTYDNPLTANTSETLTYAEMQTLFGADLETDNSTTPPTLTVNGTLITPFIGGQPPIPGDTVPSWVEVSHHPLSSSSNPWLVGQSVGTGAGAYTNSATVAVQATNSNWFGDIHPGGTDQATGSDGTQYNWKIPDANPPASALSYPFANTSYTVGYADYENTIQVAPQNTLPAIGNYSNYNPIPQSYSVINGSCSIAHDAAAQSSHESIAFSFLLDAGNTYNTTDWYFVDVEFLYDENQYDQSTTSPPEGTGSNNGIVYLPGVLQTTSTNSQPSNELIDGDYIGEWGGGSSMRHVLLVPVFRTEYSDNRWVLRAIFKLQTDSYVTSNSDEDWFTLRFYEFKNTDIKVSKIISKKINEISGSGDPTNWLNSSVYDRKHTLSNGAYFDFSASSYGATSNMYHSNSSLCWDNVPQTSNGVDVSDWTQTFAQAPQTTSTSWKLNFEVNNNPYINGSNFSGELAVRVANDTHGMVATGINAIGNYEIEFNMEADASNWTITPSGAALAYYDATTSSSANANKITFYNSDSSNPLTCAVKQIELTDLTQIFTGNTVGSWNLGGFEPSIETYIQWDSLGITANDVEPGRIQFLEAPLFDSDFAGVNPVMINQLIETPINRYEQYRVQFVYKLENAEGGPGEGELNMYYFNSLGYGFRISNIGANPIYNGSSASYSIDPSSGATIINQVVTIEELEQTEIDDINVNALKNTLVIRKENENDPTSKVTAWIDNISIKQVYIVNPDYPSKTVTFNEGVNGWSSFKSFIPESGVSLSKKYFTFKNAYLYQHYVPTLNGVISSFEQANNYNIFYDTPYKSTIKAVLNQEPSLVKTFHTIGYEGSQANVLPPDEGGVTINNANAIGGEVKGWKSIDITTDMDKGSLHSFIKKENKWFGYIKGKTAATLDSSKFSVQGIGFRDGDTTGLGASNSLPQQSQAGSSGNTGGGGNNNTGGTGGTGGGGTGGTGGGGGGGGGGY